MISEQLESALANAACVVVSTGAGISAESGVPTFRDPDGLWSKYRPQDLANFDAFIRNPDLVWEWYSYRRTLISEVQPNPGHFAIVELEKIYSDFTLITQNVDNLHRRAGSTKIHELHGNIERSFCLDCKKFHSDVEAPPSKVVQKCECGGLIRPDVVWFGEVLPEKEVKAAWDAASRADLFFSIGTSGEVYPAAQLPGVARQNGAYVVEINPNRSSIAYEMSECIESASGTALPEIAETAKRIRMSA